MDEAMLAKTKIANFHLVCVSICTYKRPKMLARCLDSLANQVLPDNILMQIVVVDNDVFHSAHQPYVAFMRNCKFPSSYIHQPKRGIAAARNKAVEYAMRPECGLYRIYR